MPPLTPTEAFEAWRKQQPLDAPDLRHTPKAVWLAAWQQATEVERARCAKVAEEGTLDFTTNTFEITCWDVQQAIAKAIRTGAEHDE